MVCPSCGVVAARRGRFCDQCGARLEGEATTAAIDRAPPPAIAAGDRRIVTALFADLVGYTKLVAELDPEDVRACVDDALAALTTQVERFGGSLEKFIGDAVFAVFGAPVAHDDDPLRAGLCALAMREAIASLRGPRTGAPLQLRIGIATGEVVAGLREVGEHRGLAVVGEAVTTAARLQQLADADHVLADETTTSAVRTRIVAQAVPHRVLKGTRRRVAIYRLVQERPRASAARLSAPIVGRDAERGELRDLLREIGATGSGHVRIVLGEPGMGKSRLLGDLEPDARAAGFSWTWAQCVSYGAGQPYRLIRKVVDALSDEEGLDAGSIVRRLLFAPDLDPGVARAYGGAVAALAHDASVDGWEAEYDFAPRDPREKALLLRDVVARFARRLGSEGPRVVVIDDMHWIDPSSLALVDAFARNCSDVPLLLLVGTRQTRVPDWASLPHVRRIELRGLSQAATARLIGSIAGTEPSEETARLLHDRSKGNPLFVAEIVRALLEARVLASRDGALVVTDPRRIGLLPLSLRALLGARIDALPPSPREVLGVAAVVGMRFTEAVVEEVLEPPPSHRDFEHLAEGGLIEAAEAPGVWRFAHPLFHDAAYVGLLAARRRALHARLADRMERIGSVDVARLAHHRAAAGDGARAIPLLERAAAEATALGASVEAAAFLRRAAELAAGREARGFAARAEEVLRDAESIGV